MIKKLILVLLLALPLAHFSQWHWDYGVSTGIANYLGDIGGKESTAKTFISDIQWSKTRWNMGGFVRYKWLPKISLRLAVDYIRLEGDDKLTTNPARNMRNFNFRNDIYDVGFTAHYILIENNDLGRTYKYKNSMRVYVFSGIGGFISNPKTLYQGQWVALQPLATEGVKYSKFVANIPMGAGMSFTFDRKHRIGIELNYRKTFTDYLDDISGNYPADPGSDYERGLILRKDELGSAIASSDPGLYNSHVWGAKRGDETKKDAYMTFCLSYSYVMRGKASFYRGKTQGYFSKKRKMRKIRAKF